jgi:hypothetical protein
MEIGIRFAWPAAEGTKLASDKADVREIYVPVDYVAHDIADQVSTQPIGSDEYAQQIRSLGSRQGIALLLA